MSTTTTTIEAPIELDTVPISADTPHENATNIALVEDIPPDGGYGWVVTACVFFINVHTWGVNSAWAIFLSHYLENSTFPGATQLEYALIGGLSISQSCLIIPAVAVSNKHLGTRITLLIGTALVFTALFGASFATKIWHLFLSQGVCFGFGMGFLYITATPVLPQWFLSRRSLALGLASSGAGLGGLAYNLAAGAAVERLGLQWTYRLLAFCTLAANFTCSMLIKDRNKTVKPIQRTFDFRGFGRVEVILVTLWGVFTELGYIVLLYSLPHYATSIGLTQRQGSIVGALLNLGLGIGRPIIGYCSDTFGRINVATLMTGLCGLICICLWIPAKSYAVLLIFALAVGPVCGIFWATVAPVTTEVVGLRHLPPIFGIICMALVLPTTFAEAIALEIVAVAGYLPSQIFVGAMFLIAAACTWLLRSWKISDIEKKDVAARLEGATDVDSDTLPKDYWLTRRGLFVRRRV